MADSNFNETIQTLFKGMDGCLSSKTVVGEPLRINDSIIIPLMDVSFGLAAGAWSKEKKDSAAGGMGGKMSAKAVLLIQNGSCRMIAVNPTDAVSKIIDIAPDIINRFTGKSKLDPDVKAAVDDMKEEKK